MHGAAPGRLIRTDCAKWGEVVRRSGARLDEPRPRAWTFQGCGVDTKWFSAWVPEV
jgi:hypothetical protein